MKIQSSDVKIDTRKLKRVIAMLMNDVENPELIVGMGVWTGEHGPRAIGFTVDIIGQDEGVSEEYRCIEITRTPHDT